MAPAAQAHHADVMARINQALTRDTGLETSTWTAVRSARKDIAVPANTVRGGTVLSARVMGKVYSPPALCCAALNWSSSAVAPKGCPVQMDRARAC